MNLDPGQVDTITFAGNSDHVAYTTTGPETPVVELGLPLDGKDYLFEVKGAAETTGVTIDLKADVPAGKLAVKINTTVPLRPSAPLPVGGSGLTAPL